jgi:hypothetical protein
MASSFPQTSLFDIARPRVARPRKSHQGLEFNPASVDATIATVIARLDDQDKRSKTQHEENMKVQSEILVQAQATNGRVTKLEKYVAALIGAWFVIGIVWQLYVHFAK